MENNDHQWVDDVFELYWDNIEKTVLVIEFHKSFDWDQYGRLMEDVYAYIGGRVDDVAYINYYHKGVLVPTGSPLPHWDVMLAKFNQPFIVTVDQKHNRPIMRFIRVFARILGLQPPFVPDFETARQIIAKHQCEQSARSA